MRSLETSPPRAGKWGYIIAASIWLVNLERPACYFSPCKVFSFYSKGGARCGSTAVLSPRLADQVKSADDHSDCVENKV